jgi:hypothetical protein
MAQIDFDYVFALRMTYEEEFREEKEINMRLIRDLITANMDRNEVPIFLKNFYDNVGISTTEEYFNELMINVVHNEQQNIQNMFSALINPANILNIVQQVEQVEQQDEQQDEQEDDEDVPQLEDQVLHDNGLHHIQALFAMLLNGGLQQAQQSDVVASLSSEDISKLEKYTLKEDLDYSCSICKTSMDTDENVCKLECGHIHHTECIEPWFVKYNYKCPVCRHEIGKPKYDNLS